MQSNYEGFNEGIHTFSLPSKTKAVYLNFNEKLELVTIHIVIYGITLFVEEPISKSNINS